MKNWEYVKGNRLDVLRKWGTKDDTRIRLGPFELLSILSISCLTPVRYQKKLFWVWIIRTKKRQEAFELVLNEAGSRGESFKQGKKKRNKTASALTIGNKLLKTSSHATWEERLHAQFQHFKKLFLSLQEILLITTIIIFSTSKKRIESAW